MDDSTSPARARQSCSTADSLSPLERRSALDWRKIVWNFLHMLMRSWGRPCHSASGSIFCELLLLPMDVRCFIFPEVGAAFLALLVVAAAAGLDVDFFATPFHFLTSFLAVLDTLASSWDFNFETLAPMSVSERMARFISTLSRRWRISKIFSERPSPLGRACCLRRSSFSRRTVLTLDIVLLVLFVQIVRIGWRLSNWSGSQERKEPGRNIFWRSWRKSSDWR
mmetsp:Transcript_37604/g.81181  ORF Transcript_37604/g.81181 Transcript_37604/m.81181 type:complete len:224 (+) Transcript_37604:538-1209(+)